MMALLIVKFNFGTVIFFNRQSNPSEKRFDFSLEMRLKKYLL